MAMIVAKEQLETLLELNDPEAGLYPLNHILEPEYHQDKYVLPYKKTSALPGAFHIGDKSKIKAPIHRGTQPKYADDENDPESLLFEGMVSAGGEILKDEDGTMNVCALKSACVRYGFIDQGLARSVTRSFYEKNKDKAGVHKNDILINSTGDGTIGRVAIYNFDFPAVVDGHITIVRYKDKQLAWYVAAYLLSDDGQRQMYRYINGSSGQVEIYPQDIERIWVRPARTETIKKVAKYFKQACKKHEGFYRDIKTALSMI